MEEQILTSGSIDGPLKGLDVDKPVKASNGISQLDFQAPVDMTPIEGESSGPNQMKTPAKKKKKKVSYLGR